MRTLRESIDKLTAEIDALTKRRQELRQQYAEEKAELEVGTDVRVLRWLPWRRRRPVEDSDWITGRITGIGWSGYGPCYRVQPTTKDGRLAERRREITIRMDDDQQRIEKL